MVRNKCHTTTLWNFKQNAHISFKDYTLTPQIWFRYLIRFTPIHVKTSSERPVTVVDSVFLTGSEIQNLWLVVYFRNSPSLKCSFCLCQFWLTPTLYILRCLQHWWRHNIDDVICVLQPWSTHDCALILAIAIMWTPPWHLTSLNNLDLLE